MLDSLIINIVHIIAHSFLLIIMASFTVSDTKPDELLVYKEIDFNTYMQEHKIITKNDGKVLFSTIPTNAIRPLFDNSFIYAAKTAYSLHHTLKITPDMIWMAITTAFAGYVDSHAEEMRHLFVDHMDKIEIAIDGDEKGEADKVDTASGYFSDKDWPHIMGKFSEAITKHTKSEVSEWIECNFSTTTEKDRLISRVIMLGALQSYFRYNVYTRCGLPAVDMTGTLADWELIRSKADKLTEYGVEFPDLMKWHTALVIVLDKFIESFKGNVDKNFWNSICDKVPSDSGKTKLEGWSLVFIPFINGHFYLTDDKTEYMANNFGEIATSDIPSSTVTVPVVFNNAGYKTNNLFYAGAIVPTYEKETNTMSVSNDWVVLEVTK